MLDVRFAGHTKQLIIRSCDQNLTNPTVIDVMADFLNREVWMECDRARKHRLLNGPVITSCQGITPHKTEDDPPVVYTTGTVARRHSRPIRPPYSDDHPLPVETGRPHMGHVGRFIVRCSSCR